MRHALNVLAVVAPAWLREVGLNTLRLGECFLETARTKTRVTPFARLMAESAAT